MSNWYPAVELIASKAIEHRRAQYKNIDGLAEVFISNIDAAKWSHNRELGTCQHYSTLYNMSL